MRIALAIQHFPPYHGGAEQQARLLARRLGDLVERCDVITSRHDEGLPKVSHEGAARVVRLATGGPLPIRRALNGLAAFGYFLLHGARYDVVHAHCLSPFSLGAIQGARLRGARTVLKVCTVGARGDVAKVQGGALGAWLWRGFDAADRWIVTSGAGHDEVSGALRGPARVTLVPNALDTTRPPSSRDPRDLAEARRALGLADRPTCLFVGRLVPGKGLDAIMEAWPGIQTACGATLTIVGDGPLATELRAWAEAPPQAGSVQLAGWREDPALFYAASDVLLFPSASEAFGNVLAEAMAHGLAVVTTPVGLAARYARHRDNAWLLPGADDRATLALALGQAARELLADSALRLAIGERARATAHASFASEHVVRSYLELYHSLAVAPPRTAHAPPLRRGPDRMETDHA